MERMSSHFRFWWPRSLREKPHCRLESVWPSSFTSKSLRSVMVRVSLLCLRDAREIWAARRWDGVSDSLESCLACVSALVSFPGIIARLRQDASAGGGDAVCAVHGDVEV